MIIDARLRFLGTGGSMGVPVIGCPCHVCTSQSPFNKRYRPSVICQIGPRNILIDCGPDFRAQALAHQITNLDGIIFTHSHNDHTAGIDDLRIFCLRAQKGIPCLLSNETLEDLKKRFYYLFDAKSVYFPYTTHFIPQLLEKDRGNVEFLGVNIHYFSYKQVGTTVNGFRFKDLAYVSDIRDYSETIFEDLKGIKTLILSALRLSASPMHFSVEEAVAFAERVGASKTWLMHIAHELDHEATNASLPEHVRLAYDGLQLDFQVDIL